MNSRSVTNVHRLSRDVTQLLLHRASLSTREVEEATARMVRTVRCAGACQEKVDAIGEEER